MGGKEGEDGESGREWRIEEVGRVRGRKKRGLRRESKGLSSWEGVNSS